MPSSRANATIIAVSRSPSSVPCSRTVASLPYLSTSRTPGRSAERVISIDSHGEWRRVTSPVRRSRVDSDGGSISRPSARSTTLGSSSVSTTASMMPRLARFSLTWMPGGNGRFSSSSNTLGPRNPIRAPGSATVMCPSDPHDAKTPPVVGWRR